MRKNEYGEWEIIDTLPDDVVKYRHDYTIWKFCQDPSQPEYIFKKGLIDEIWHFFSKHGVNKWVQEDTLPEQCEEIKHLDLRTQFAQFVDWTYYGVIGIDYKFYKKGSWHGEWLLYKKKIDRSWLKIPELSNLCTLFDQHNPTDEIPWTYFQVHSSDEYLIKATITPDNITVAFMVNRKGDMEHIDNLPEEKKEINPKLFFDFINEDGWEYFTPLGLNKKLYRSMKDNNGEWIYQHFDQFGNWVRI